jgi:hypothetical protein
MRNADYRYGAVPAAVTVAVQHSGMLYAELLL